MFNGSNYRVQYGNRVRRQYGRRTRGQYRQRSVIPRQYIPSKMTKSEVSKIAKKVVTNQVETKMFENQINQTLVGGAWYVTNLFTGFTQNPSSEGHIGRRIDLQAIRLRMRLANSADSSASGAVYRIIIFKTSQQLTASSSAAVPQSSIFRNGATTFDPNLFVDTDSVDVIMDYAGVINPQTTSTTGGDVDYVVQDLPFKRKLEFLFETSSYTKQDNYYIYYGMQRDNGLITNAGFTSFAWQIQYTDA